MIWASPWAWGLAALAILPLVAHLWSRRQPTPLLFSTLRFLRAASPVSRHLRRVQDWPLLLVRLAIVAAIASAAAGPTVMTPARMLAERTRLHRVVVVEPGIAREAADVLGDWRREAASIDVRPAVPLSVALPDAIARVAAASAFGRAELAIAWSGRTTSLPPRLLVDIPNRVGIRLAIVNARSRETATRGNLAIEGAPDDAAVSARLRAIADTPTIGPGVLAAGLGEVRLLLPGVPRPAPTSRPATPDAIAFLQGLERDPRIRSAAERSVVDTRVMSANAVPAQVLAHDGRGQRLLSGWADGDRVTLALATTPGAPLALWTVVVAREALERPDLHAVTPIQWTADAIAGASRPALAPDAVTMSPGLETRWAWAAALVLLLVEGLWRRRAVLQIAKEAPDAA